MCPAEEAQAKICEDAEDATSLRNDVKKAILNPDKIRHESSQAYQECVAYTRIRTRDSFYQAYDVTKSNSAESLFFFFSRLSWRRKLTLNKLSIQKRDSSVSWFAARRAKEMLHQARWLHIDRELRDSRN